MGKDLINKIIFLEINQIFTYDDIIFRRLYDNIYSIYTYKNVLELLALEENSDQGEKTIPINSGNKKKKKKKNNKKSVDKKQINDLENTEKEKEKEKEKN